MGDAEVEGAPRDRALDLEGAVVAEVVPVAEREDRQVEAGAARAPVLHLAVVAIGRRRVGHRCSTSVSSILRSPRHTLADCLTDQVGRERSSVRPICRWTFRPGAWRMEVAEGSQCPHKVPTPVRRPAHCSSALASSRLSARSSTMPRRPPTAGSSSWRARPGRKDGAPARAMRRAPRGTRVLWGGCDPMFTPRPLGPLLDIAERPAARSPSSSRPARSPTDRGRPHARPGATRADWCSCSRTCTGPTKRRSTSSACSPAGSATAGARARELPGRRTRSADPLRILLGELATRRTSARLPLAPLSPEAVAKLAAPHGVDADKLYRTTDGNPFFVTEVLAAGEEQIPPTVRDAVLARTARLSPGAGAARGRGGPGATGRALDP